MELIQYKKLLSFTFIYLNLKKDLFIARSIYPFLKIIKFLISSKNTGVFLPINFELNTQIFFSFWIDGFISNFKRSRWLFIRNFNLSTLPSVLLNFTENGNITKEIKHKQLPLINITGNNHNYIYADYFFKDTFFLDYYTNYLDNIYFYIYLLKYLKRYKNV